MSDKKEGILQELFDSFKYMRESKKGKYSLDTYLDIVGEYADRLIVQCKNEGYGYMGGHCKVSSDVEQPNQFLFQIELFFEKDDGNNLKKEAERCLTCSMFTSETITRIKEHKEMVFDIKEPAEGE